MLTQDPQAPDSTFTRRVVLAVTTALAAVLLAVLIIYTAEILTLLFAAVLLAVFISAPSQLLARYARIPRLYAVLATLATLLILVGLFFFALGNTLYAQVQELKVTLPRAMTTLEQDLRHTNWLQHLLPAPATATAPADLATTATAPGTASAPAETTLLADLAAKTRDLLTDAVTSQSFYRKAGGAITATFGIIGDAVVVLAIGLYLALSPGLYASGLVSLFPIRRRPRVREILSHLSATLQWWFVGQLAAMACIGLLTTIGLLILGVPAALTLGILAAVMTFVPNFGPIIAAIPAVVIAFAPHGDQTAVNPLLALYVIILYLVVQFLEGWLITPMIQRRAVEIPPALIMFAQVVLALLLGPLGLVLATPILAALLVLIKMIYIEDILGDRSDPIEARNKA